MGFIVYMLAGLVDAVRHSLASSKIRHSIILPYLRFPLVFKPAFEGISSAWWHKLQYSYRTLIFFIIILILLLLPSDQGRSLGERGESPPSETEKIVVEKWCCF